MIFGTYKLNKATNETVLTLQLLSTLVRQRALESRVLSLHYLFAYLTLYHD